MNEEDIANYLGSYPEFFERHSELLAAVHLTSPHGKRAVSLQERQAEMLRDKIKMLERRIMDMIRNGNDNMALSDKLLRWAADLLQAQADASLPEYIAATLQAQFLVPQVAIKVWGLDPEFAEAEFAQGISGDAQSFAASLHEPFCGLNTGFEATSWLAQPELAISVALLPLRGVEESPVQSAFGMLVLASPDAQRFASSLGTEFLSRIAELASAALSPLR